MRLWRVMAPPPLLLATGDGYSTPLLPHTVAPLLTHKGYDARRSPRTATKAGA
jgi:hypothetical protein